MSNSKNNSNIKGGIPMKNKIALLLVAALLIAVFSISAASFARGYNSLQSTEASTAASDEVVNDCSGAGFCMQGRGYRLDDWAAALNLSVDELASLKQQGKTIAEIAAEKGISLEEAVDKILSRDRAYLDELVKSGKLTQEQAESILSFRKERLLERAGTNGRPSWAGKGRAGNGACAGSAGCGGNCFKEGSN